MKIILTILFSILIVTGQAQNSVRDLEKYLEDIKKQPYLSLPKTILEDQKNENKQLKLLKTYTNDSLAIVRNRSYYLIKIIGKRSDDASVRQTAVTALLEGIKDKDTGISGSNSEALKGFEKKDFTVEAKFILVQFLKPGTPHLFQIIRLTGFLDLKDQQGKLTELMNAKTSANEKWACHLALARMGEPTSVNFILDKAKSITVDDNLVYGIAPDLIYTRQKAIFDYLVTIVNLDTATCQSANPDSSQKILCGYRLMEYLARHIKGFPVEVDEFGDLKDSDYEKSLKTVRQWFASNPNYEILTDKY